MKGIVYKSTGSWYSVKGEDAVFYKARIKGKLKLDKSITSTNPIAVGDEVVIEMENEEEASVMISAISQRKNYVVRTSPHNKNQKHIVASNIDQALLIATLRSPKTSMGFLDRFLVTCEAYRVPAILVFNKADLLQEKDLALYHYLQNIYEIIGYTCILISAETQQNINALHALLAGKTTLFTGHSGVGKSTVINYLLPTVNIKTQAVSNWSGKGMHTTTYAQMHDLANGKIIDTPGIRELGIVDIGKNELCNFYPEMNALKNKCKFNNCIHINEPNCVVQEAVQNGTISVDRYGNYLSIMDSLGD